MKDLSKANKGLQKLAKEAPALVEERFGYDVPGFADGADPQGIQTQSIEQLMQLQKMIQKNQNAEDMSRKDITDFLLRGDPKNFKPSDMLDRGESDDILPILMSNMNMQPQMMEQMIERGGIADLMEEPQKMFLGGLLKKAKKAVKKGFGLLSPKVFDDILGLDPSGKGLIGSIKDNPKTAALIGSLLIPGAGSALSGALGSAGTAVGNVGSNILGGLGSIGSAIGSGLGTVGEFILPGADKIGLFGNVGNLLGGGIGNLFAPGAEGQRNILGDILRGGLTGGGPGALLGGLGGFDSDL